MDAAFGAGFSRTLDGDIATFLTCISQRRLPMVAVDVPSGVHGTTGAVDRHAIQAALTITFARPKTGHLLLPGRQLCGTLVVADIGIPNELVSDIAPLRRHNRPGLWRSLWPRRAPDSHKYALGHAAIIGGPAHRCGATVMAASASERVGAGLVTVLCQSADASMYAGKLLEIMTAPLDDVDDLEDWLGARRVSAVALGPALGLDKRAAGSIEACLHTRLPIALDADALSLIGMAPDRFRPLLHKQAVLTPHDGEFNRLFELSGGRLQRAEAAAKASGAIILLKGGDTVVAAPDGRSTVTTHAPPSLARAGSGDILTGLITGLLAQGMPAFEAACAGVWLHGEAARHVPPEGFRAADAVLRSDAIVAALRQLASD